MAFNLPPLPTLDQPPSWCNARGHVDRSACIEIRVSEARELAGCVPHKNRGFARGTESVLPLPHQRPAGNFKGRVATGVITITAHDVHRLHQHRTPRALAGDLRTARANAMRCTRFKPSKYKRNTFRCRVDRRNPVAWPPERNLDGNPNKGASREKIIGLPRNWSQPVRMEMWQYKDRIRPAYFFDCPGHIAPGSPAVDATYCPGLGRGGRRFGAKSVFDGFADAFAPTPGKPGAM